MSCLYVLLYIKRERIKSERTTEYYVEIKLIQSYSNPSMLLTPDASTISGKDLEGPIDS